ncbi:hypothetical protein [Variovorax ginsengisoli]|uniref:Uncharacterized protein n=1 Tax=Variovorax ginsengisoli TaxID=363844 RepID=A0ABT9SDP5_9BURK|nr:hypothetical protein [Variovorax ginsengisoli]MDP9902487.1 hypothetical protein [Variovorax ginsengisoli]
MDAAVSKTIGLLNGIQWLLRDGRANPTQLGCTDGDLVGMLDLVKEQLAEVFPSAQLSP